MSLCAPNDVVGLTNPHRVACPFAIIAPAEFGYSLNQDEMELLEKSENYCRNPTIRNDRWARADCWTGGGAFEDCNVPYCADTFIPRRMCGTRSKLQSDYRGDLSITESGRECVHWDSMEDKHNRKHLPWE